MRFLFPFSSQPPGDGRRAHERHAAWLGDRRELDSVHRKVSGGVHTELAVVARAQCELERIDRPQIRNVHAIPRVDYVVLRVVLEAVIGQEEFDRTGRRASAETLDLKLKKICVVA